MMQVFVGSFIYSRNLNELEILHNTAVFVSGEGQIKAVTKDLKDTQDEAALKNTYTELGWESSEVIVKKCRSGQFFFPGFIDTHIHAPQYPNAGIFGKSTLLDWLNTYTFPMEASLKDLEKARKVYSTCISRTLSHGTTTAAYYATIDVASTNLLADLCLSAGQRGFIGRCCMDSDQQPEWYRDESSEKAIADTKATIEHIKSIDPDYAIVSPIITPRFAPSCTRPTMHSLGDLAAKTGLPIQTHISENKGEIELVKKLFPEFDTYTDVYDHHKLLTSKTILAHAIYLSEEEASLIKKRDAKVSHCPVSNSAITSGVARVRWLLNKGIDVGLGTDMSGGYSPSVLEAVRQASLVSRHVALVEGDEAKLSVEEVLYLSTKGGAKVVGLEKNVGAFEVGMDWDAQLIGLRMVGDEKEGDERPVDIFGWETWDDRVAKWVYNGDDRNTLAVWVKGKLVHERKR